MMCSSSHEFQPTKAQAARAQLRIPRKTHRDTGRIIEDKARKSPVGLYLSQLI